MRNRGHENVRECRLDEYARIRTKYVRPEISPSVAAWGGEVSNVKHPAPYVAVISPVNVLAAHGVAAVHRAQPT